MGGDIAGVLWASIVCVAVVGCSREATYADARASLATEERAALDAVLRRAGVDAASVLARDDLFDVTWRGAASYARLHGQADRASAIERRTPDRRNAVAVQGGHVVALRLTGGRLDDLRLVAPLTHLVVLDVHDQAIERIDDLEQLRDLDHLDLSGNHLTSLHGLEGAQALRSLYVADNRLTGFDGIDGLRSLEVLNVSGNAIATLDGLRGVPALRALSAERCPIVRIEGLEGSPELVDLDLAFCQIERLENLGTLPKLKYLNLWHNRVHSLEGAEAAASVVYLGLGENGYPVDGPADANIRERFCASRLCDFL